MKTQMVAFGHESLRIIKALNIGNVHKHRPILTQIKLPIFANTDQYKHRPIPTQDNTNTDQYKHRAISTQANINTDQYQHRLLVSGSL